MPLLGESFCPSCGQKNDARKLNAWELITEGLSGLFSFDSKVFRSLKPMLTRPGQIVLNYVSGKRASYVHPARMYLSVSIIYFLIQSLFSGSSLGIVTVQGDIDSQENSNIISIFFEPDSLSENEYSRIAHYVRHHPLLGWEEVVNAGNIAPNFWKHYYFVQSQKMMNLQWKSFIAYVKSKLPFILFLIIPVLAVYLKLFYLRKGIYYADHLIFAFYTQSALFLWLALGAILDITIGTKMENVFFLVFFFYLYFSFRRVYCQSRLISLLKVIMITTLYIFSGVLFLFLAGVVLFLGY